MTIASKKIRLFGQTRTIFQVIKDGEVVKVCETRDEAQAWINKQ